MKNSKPITYILLALVVGIWGYVIYSVLAKVNEPDGLPIRQALQPMEEENLAYYRWKDTLHQDSLIASPFSSAQEVDERTSAPPADVYPAAEVYDPLAYAPAVDVQYLGFIENEKQGQRVALVQINGRQHYLQPRQSVDGMTLLQIDQHHIRIQTDGHILTIDKQ